MTMPLFQMASCCFSCFKGDFIVIVRMRFSMIVRCVSKFFYCCIQSFFCLVFMLIAQFIFYIVKVLKFVSPISFDSGHSSSQTIAQYGNSSKPFVFYAETDISSPLSSSSVGLLINRGDSTKKINLAVDNIGVEVSYTSNNIVQSSSHCRSFGLRCRRNRNNCFTSGAAFEMIIMKLLVKTTGMGVLLILDCLK